jgi:hypothetical protein
MVLGVDLSTKAIDLVALDEDNPAMCEHRRVELPDPWWNTARWMRSLLRVASIPTWLEERNVYLVGVERPYGPSRQAIASLHTVMGALIASLPPQVTAFEVSPADMRRELGLPGNCPKEQMRREVTRRMPHLTWTDDAYDAWAAGYAALWINERGTPMEGAA